MRRGGEEGLLRYVVTALAVAMSLYHLYIAYMGALEPVLQRTLSYLFVAALIFLLHRGPAEGKRGGWAFLLAGVPFLLAVSSVGWLLWNYDYVLDRFPYVHPLTALDLLFGAVAILLVLEAGRRTVGLILPLISALFLAYTYLGPYMPLELAHPGASLQNIIDHQYMTTEGLWTVPMGVFTTYILLFILFGAFLDKMGAAEFYIRFSTALMGGLAGGPAKVAIVASGLVGMITGSANANVVTTGTFTIPMMKRAGFRPEFAGGVETAASTGGQVMPPVMGVSAFLIAEFTGISYWEVVQVSIVPALLYFFSIYMIVHLEARKQGLEGLPREELPPLWPTFRGGWFFLLPPVVIVYYMADGQPVPYAGLAGIASVVVLGALRGALDLLAKARREGLGAGELLGALARGLWNVVQGLEGGARNSLPVAAACAVVGIIMGALFQTGLGTKFSSLVVNLAQGSLFLGIWLVGFASFILGMGLPTTSAYIVLSVMAVPAMIELGEGVGLTLLAAHLIVFWYSLDSSFTPPVCLPAYTAAGLAGGDPNKTGLSALRLAKGMYIVPFLFAYSQPFLLNGPPASVIESWVAATLGFIAFGAAFEGRLYAPTALWERVLLTAASLGLFWPGTLPRAAGAVGFALVFASQRRGLARAALARGAPSPGPARALSGKNPHNPGERA